MMPYVRTVVDLLAHHHDIQLQFICRRASRSRVTHIVRPDDLTVIPEMRASALVWQQERFRHLSREECELAQLMCGDIAEIYDPIDRGPHEWATHVEREQLCSKCVHLLGEFSGDFLDNAVRRYNDRHDGTVDA